MVLAFSKHIQLRFTASFQPLCAAQVSESTWLTENPPWKWSAVEAAQRRAAPALTHHPPAVPGAARKVLGPGML